MGGLVPRGDQDEPRLPYRPRAAVRCGGRRGILNLRLRSRAKLPRGRTLEIQGERPAASSQDTATTQAGPPARAEKLGCLSCAAGPRPPPTEPRAAAPPRLSLSSTARYPKPSRPDWMLRPPRPPPVSRRSRGLWTVALGSFPLPPTWPSSPALQARDRRRLLQKLPHCQPALAAASFHRGWRITRSPACPSAGADDPGWNLNSPAPAPIHNPRGRLPLHAAPAPALVPARWPCDVSVARCSSATQTVPRAPAPPGCKKGGWVPLPGGGRVKRAWLITQRACGSAGAHRSPVAQRIP